MIALARPIAQAEGASWGRLLRARYQIGAGLLVAVLMPAWIQAWIAGVEIAQPTQMNAIVGGAIALILGFLCFRRLHIFPGISSGGYIITAFSITFGVAAAVFFSLRLEYGRIQFVSSYLLTLAFFVYVHIRFAAHKPIRLGVIMGPDSPPPPPFARVIWYPIESPHSPLPPVVGVVADLTADYGDEWRSRITSCVLAGVPVYHIKQATEQLSGRVEIDHLAENTLGSLNPNAVYLKLKAIFDTIVSLALLIVLAPAFLVIGLLIAFDSPGPVLFRQSRTGFRTRPFKVFKFRTMYTSGNQAEMDLRRLAMTQDKDPRITRIGAFLRRTRIDELPQLINVVRGEMSLIGPRPEAIPLTRWYESEIPFYHYRHILKPGITGWAQVNQGHVADVGDVKTKLHLDFYYVKNFLVWLDILIAIKTLQVIFTGHGAK